MKYDKQDSQSKDPKEQGDLKQTDTSSVEDQVKEINEDRQASKDYFKKLALSCVGGIVVGGLVVFGINQANSNGKIPGNIITTNSYKMSSKEAFSFLIKNTNNQQSILGYTMNKVLLGDDKKKAAQYAQKAQKSMNAVIAQFGTRAAFNSALQQKNTTIDEYLLSIENVMIIKDKIKEQYKPTDQQIKNAYNTLGNTYNLSGIILTPQNANLKDSVEATSKKAAELADSKNLDLDKALKDNKNSKQFNVSGLTSTTNTTLNDVSSSSNTALPSNVLSQIAKTKEGQSFTVNSKYGHYIIKVNKVIQKGSLSQERAGIVSQLKEAEASNSSKQAAFAAKLLKDSGFKSSNKDVQNVITTTEANATN